MAEKEVKQNRDHYGMQVFRDCAGKNYGGLERDRCIINMEIKFDQNRNSYFAKIDLSEIEKEPFAYSSAKDRLIIIRKSDGFKKLFLLDELIPFTSDNGSGVNFGKTFKEPEFTGYCKFAGGWVHQKDGKRYDIFEIEIKPRQGSGSHDIDFKDIDIPWDNAV